MTKTSLHAHRLNGVIQAEDESLGSVALRLAQGGYSVFPLKPRAKDPATPHGFYDATTDVERVRQWWSKRPDSNIGVATGEPSGVFVVDIDPRNGGDETWARLCDGHGEPDTLRVMTADGFHLYFRMPASEDIRCGEDRLGKGIDVKAEGGYVVSVGSVHPDGHKYVVDDLHHSYRLDRAQIADAPEWILERVRQRPQKPSSVVSVVSVVSVSSVDALIKRTAARQYGTRNRQILDFARGLRFDLGMADAGLDQLRPIVARWWETSRPHITTDDFTTTWADFLHAFERAKLPLSADVAGAAFARARERVQDDDRQLLIEACRELQAVKGHGEGGQLLPFSLSCSQVARHLWGSDEKSLRWKASRWLKMLCREGVLELVTKGNAGPAGSPASRYRFIEGNPND